MTNSLIPNYPMPIEWANRSPDDTFADLVGLNWPLVLRTREYAEASYFDGYHFQHIAAYHEHLRLRRINDTNRRLWRERKGR